MVVMTLTNAPCPPGIPDASRSPEAASPSGIPGTLNAPGAPRSAIAPATRGVIQLAVAMVLSGTIGVFVLESGAEPATAAWFRCAIGSVAMGLYSLGRGYFRSSGYTQRLVLLAAAGGVALVTNWVLLFAAYRNTSIGIATVAYHVQPFLLILAAAVVLRERVTRVQVLWVALGFVGLLLIAQPWRQAASGAYVLGILQAVAAAALYAVATLIAKRITGVRPHVTVVIQLVVGAVLLAPLVSWGVSGGGVGGGGGVGAAVATGWPWLLGLGVIHTGVMYLLMYSAFPVLRTPVIAVLGFIYPVVALVVDVVVYGTSLSLPQIMGVFAILAAGVANTRPGRRGAAES